MQKSEFEYVRNEVLRSRDHLEDETVVRAVKVQSDIRSFAGSFLRSSGYIEIPPVIISPLTDPLNHPVIDPRIKSYGGDFWLTKSMIFHKQIAVQSLKKIFIMSPNIRLELEEKRLTGRHLYEFTQIDIEALNHSRDQMMTLAETLIKDVIRRLKNEDAAELRYFGRTLPDFAEKFRQVKYLDALKEYGDRFEKALSESSREPVWIVEYHAFCEPEVTAVGFYSGINYRMVQGISEGGNYDWRYLDVTGVPEEAACEAPDI